MLTFFDYVILPHCQLDYIDWFASLYLFILLINFKEIACSSYLFRKFDGIIIYTCNAVRISRYKVDSLIICETHFTVINIFIQPILDTPLASLCTALQHVKKKWRAFFGRMFYDEGSYLFLLSPNSNFFLFLLWKAGLVIENSNVVSNFICHCSAK